ncbi:MAG TPA: hypothetical protein VLJ37_04795 [bacterium]|nr:hypothetical protein [bacterium]
MMRLAQLNFPAPVLSVPVADIARSEWMAERIGEALSVPRPFGRAYQRLPVPLRHDDALLERLHNLIEPVGDKGLKGSYAGWITRAALGEAAVRADEAALVSLVDFFSQGGSLAELERRAALVLGPMEPGREQRRRRLLESDDPLRSSKLAELSDGHFKIGGGSVLPEERQAAAYLADAGSLAAIRRIRTEGPVLMEEGDARARYRRTREVFGIALGNHRPGDRFWPHQVKRAFQGLGDPVSVAAAGRIGRAYNLVLVPDGEFESRVLARRARERHRDFLSPSTQDAIFFSRSSNGGAELYARTRPLSLPWCLEPEDVLRAVLENIVHENRHSVDFEARGARPIAPEEHFPLEFRAHADAFLWSALQGDPRDLRRFSVDHPLGPGLAFRDHFESNY